ncbi:MAG: serine/threonine protein kinase [Blastocatellia bacterium]
MLAVGTTLIDRYRITGYIHKGGMGAVYHAHDQLDNIVVAVKQSFYADENFLREQFRREATLLRRLDHPALPKVHNYFAEGGGQFLVMDFVEGEDLEHLLQRNQGPLPLKQVLEWADRILDALDYLHTNKPIIIHRDIKPANLKLTPAGDIMLLDFGLAKNETTPTLPGRSIAAATPEYAPPEQINREGTDPRSDLFSFGATLYHLLTNQVPISAGIRDGVVKQGARDPLRPAGEINPLIPPAISGVIHKAMAIARDQRYTSGGAMRIALREATGSGSATVIDPPPPQPWERRHTQPRQPTVAPPPTPQPTTEPSADWEKAPTPAPVRLRKPLLIGVAASLVVLALLGYWLLSGQPSAPVESSAPVDVLSYSLEYKPDERNRFRFHFKSRRNGFLYIVAPNAEKQWITFLTARPYSKTGVNDNEIKAGQDYQFFGGGQWIVMRADPASFTLIFSAKKLAQPGFLNADAGSPLSEDDNRALDELRRQSQTRKPRLDADETGATIRALEASDAPLVTDIRVAWNAR